MCLTLLCLTCLPSCHLSKKLCCPSFEKLSPCTGQAHPLYPCRISHAEARNLVTIPHRCILDCYSHESCHQQPHKYLRSAFVPQASPSVTRLCLTWSDVASGRASHADLNWFRLDMIFRQRRYAAYAVVGRHCIPFGVDFAARLCYLRRYKKPRALFDSHGWGTMSQLRRNEGAVFNTGTA
jgi:hypothetical protein